MSRFEQYEVWELHGERWEQAGSFVDLEVASAMAGARQNRVRVMRVAYENGKPPRQEVLAEVGSTRKQP